MSLRRVVPWLAVPLLAVVPAAAQATPSLSAVGGALPTCTASPVLLNHPDAVDQHFGASIAVADLNHDGIADLAVGAPQDLDHFTRSGQVYAYISRSGGTHPGSPKVLTQAVAGGLAEPGDDYGTALAAGDLNGDGYADLVVGDPGEAPGDRPAAGAFAVFLGGRAGPAKGTFHTWSGAAGDRFGAALAIGDFDHDGYADLAVGVPGRDHGAGAVVVYPGSRTGLLSGHVIVQEGHGGHSEPGDHFGAALAAGDLTGDRYADLAIGAPTEAPGAEPAGGAVTVLKGSARGLRGDTVLTTGSAGGQESAGTAFGAALAIGDGSLYVGAPAATPSVGTVEVFPGAAGGVKHGHALARATSGQVAPRAGDAFGSAVAVGDTDGDGYADIVVGAPGTGSAGGVVDVFGGGPSGVDTGRPVSDADLGVGGAVDSRVGAAVAVGDLTGDGHPDVIAGAPGMLIAGQSGAGAVHVAAGCPTTTRSTTAVPSPIPGPAG